MAIRDILEDEERDRELAKQIADEIEVALEALHRSINTNRLEEIERLGNTIEDLCSAYREIREIDGS